MISINLPNFAILSLLPTSLLFLQKIFALYVILYNSSFYAFLQVVKRRVDLLTSEGITFHTNVNVGKDISAKALLEENDAVLLTVGATWPRDLPIPGMLFLIHSFFKSTYL